MEFSANWVVYDISDYDTSMPAVNREYMRELLAQLRNT
jgi:hypothetical protein